MDWATLAAVIAILGTVLISNHHLRTEMMARFDKQDAKFEAKFDAFDTRLEALDRKYDKKIDEIRRDILSLSRDINRNQDWKGQSPRHRQGAPASVA